MEIKARLKKPCTEEARINFIIDNNHKLGYEIRESEEAYEAWGYTEEEKAEQRKQTFKQSFFEIPTVNDGELQLFEGGWYRKKPKGYSSAIESLNTTYNVVLTLGLLPADTLIFYQEPDFTKAEECTEEWLVAHQFKNEQLTKEQFLQFYQAFVQAWNNQEH